jgi:hypothetical protein
MTFTYQASDGYAGGSRPLHCKIPDQDILDCDSFEDAMEMIEEYIQEDFLQKVSASYDYEDIKAKVSELMRENSGEQDPV